MSGSEIADLHNYYFVAAGEELLSAANGTI